VKIITEIKVIEIEEDIYELAQVVNNRNNRFIEFGGKPISIETVRELIKGRRFVDTKRGLDIVLGCS